MTFVWRGIWRALALVVMALTAGQAPAQAVNVKLLGTLKIKLMLPFLAPRDDCETRGGFTKTPLSN